MGKAEGGRRQQATREISVKVIIETDVLTDEEKVVAARLVADASAPFAKICTRFGLGRGTVHDVAPLNQSVGERIAVKAAGSVATIEDGVAFMRAGGPASSPCAGSSATSSNPWNGRPKIPRGRHEW